MAGTCLSDAAGQPTRYEYACLLNPRDMDGDFNLDTWYLDENQDGRNDLLVSLGVLPGTDSSTACEINDHGMVIRDCWGPTVKSFPTGCCRAAVSQIGNLIGNL